MTKLPKFTRGFKCPYCKHIWVPKTDAPKKCPKCQGKYDLWTEHLWGSKKHGIPGIGGWVDEKTGDIGR